MRLRALSVAVAILLIGLCPSAPTWAQEHDRSPAPPTSSHAPPPEARVDINHASESQLMKVPGMTRSWAERILRYRPYRTKQDLFDRGVVTSEVYDRIKDFIIAHREKQ